MDGDGLLTTAQAARILGVTERRVRQLASTGKLPGGEETSAGHLLPADAVRDLAKARRSGRVRTASGSGRPAAADDLEAILTRVLEATLPRAVEAATEPLRLALAEETAKRKKAERELRKLQEG